MPMSVLCAMRDAVVRDLAGAQVGEKFVVLDLVRSSAWDPRIARGSGLMISAAVAVEFAAAFRPDDNIALVVVDSRPGSGS